MEDINLCNDNGDLIRDNYYIVCTIQKSTPQQKSEIIRYRNVKQIGIDQFCKDINESPTLNYIQGTVDRYSIGKRALRDPKRVEGVDRCITNKRLTI